MLFFEQYFNKHHFFHAPHKWFLALLASPIHFLEVRYKTKYHLNYENAKKLFVFDLLLFASTVALIGLTIFWFTYQPGIAHLIDLKIYATPTKIKSGDFVTFNVNYKNNSGKKIKNVSLVIDLPTNFVFNKATPEKLYSPTNHIFELSNLNNGGYGEASISGWFYGKPEEENFLTAVLNYQQDKKDYTEKKVIPLIQILRGSVLAGEWQLSDKILANGFTNFKLKLTNQGEQTLENISLPLSLAPGLNLTNLNNDKGKINQNIWQIEKLAKNETTTLSGQLLSNLTKQTDTIKLEIIPTITIGNNQIVQTPFTKNLQIIKPEVNLTADWETNTIKPGQTKELKITLMNTGKVEVENINLKIALPTTIINTSLFANNNRGQLKDNSWLTNKNFLAELEKLLPGEEKTITLSVPVLTEPQGGQNLNLIINPRLIAQIPGLNDNFLELTAASPPLKVGSNLIMNGELRYYTEEGDQLGRGPLPPQVGKETKYWVLLKIKNTTNELTGIKFNADLPSFVSWTGKTSVSAGRTPIFDNGKVSWTLNSLKPFESVGLYFEIALTPSASQVGTTPIIIKNLKIQGFDTYLEENLIASTADLDISLKNDNLGQIKGTLIQ